MFGKRGILLILLVTLLTAFTVNATFTFQGLVAYPNGTLVNGANVTLSIPSWLTQANAQWNGSWTNLTNASGGFTFNVSGNSIDTGVPNLKLTIRYNITSGAGAASYINGTTYVGPNLPPFPVQMYDGTMNPSLLGQTFYMVRAGAITLTVLSDSLLNSSAAKYANFSYIIRDTTLGSEVDSYLSPTSNIFNVTIPLPMPRNYTIDIMLNNGPPLKWTNLTYHNFTTTYNLSAGYNDGANSSVILYAALELNATTSAVFVDGFLIYPNGTRLVNGTMDANLTNFNMWMSIVGGSNYVCMSDNCLLNITNFKGPYSTKIGVNLTHGYYNYTFAGTNYGLSSLLVVLVNKSGTWYVGLQNITTNYDGSVVPQLAQNITMLPIAGSTYVSGTNLKSPQTFIRLQNSTGSPADNIGQAMMEIQLDYNISNWGFVPTLSIQTNNTGIATFPLSSSYGIKSVKTYASSYPPREVKFAASAMDGDISVTLYNMQSQNFDGSANLGATIQMLVSNSSCDVISPLPNCTITTTADSAFNPLSAILRGKVSMRLAIPGGMTLHYIDVDLLSSGPPDFITDQNPTSGAISQGSLNDVKRFGSRGPKIYAGVLVGLNYSANLPDLSRNVTMQFSTLYDSENSLIWNISANGTGYLNIKANYSEYADYNNTWFTGQDCNIALNGQLTLNTCLYNRTSRVMWMYLPHFSTLGSQITGVTAGNMTLNVSESTLSCNTFCGVYFNVTNLNYTISLAAVNWTINITTNATTLFPDPVSIYYMNASESKWYANGTNVSYYSRYNLTYYNSTDGASRWNTTHQYLLNFTRASNITRQFTINFTIVTFDGVGVDLTRNVSINCVNSWTTPEWGTCTGGVQTRVVLDRSACGNIVDKPAESQSCVTGGGSGGGGGGAASTSVTWTTMSSGVSYVYDVPDSSIAFEKLTIVPNTALTNVKVVVRQLPEQPSDVIKAPVGTVFKYMSIAKEGIVNSQIQSAKVTFGVDKSWVDGKGKKENVVLLRYAADKWEKLTTRYTGEANGKYQYESNTPGFSYFAITFQTPEEQTKQEQQDKETASAETAPETAEPENVFEEKEAKKSSWWTVVAALVVVLAVVIAFYFVYKHKKKSGSLEGYRYKPRH